VRAAATVARRFAAGDFDARASVRNDELGKLSATLNSAGARMGQLVGALTRERQQIEALLNASSDATVAVDSAGNVVYVSDGARDMLEGRAEAVAGRPFIELVRDHDVNDMLIAAVQRGERSVRLVPYGHAQRWLQVTAVPVSAAGTWAAVAVFHDLTEVRRLDSVRRDFVSNVSHELRTPLAGIRAAAETLHEGALDDPPAAREFLGHIQRETDRMTQMVEELLELSRIESGASALRFEQLDVGMLIDDTARRFARQAQRAGITLTAEPATDAPAVTADGDRLERALGNLVANAIKFTPAGGCVTIGARSLDGDLLISVEDTGVGIEVDQQARVFERFFKADRGRGGGGSGLGLAIVKHIAQAHHGDVSVASRPGRGSTFTLRLPVR
jgi:two-component system phosphate regulon sensor histidine kinase PhoR